MEPSADEPRSSTAEIIAGLLFTSGFMTLLTSLPFGDHDRVATPSGGIAVDVDSLSRCFVFAE
jgi:hypothetical protein